MKKFYKAVLITFCLSALIFSACTTTPGKNDLYVQMETAIRTFINKNRRPIGYQIAAFAYKEETLKGEVKELKDGRIFIGQWEISPLPGKGHYTAFLGKRFGKGIYYEYHSLRLELKQNKDGTFEVISSQPVKKWGSLNNDCFHTGKLIADTATKNPDKAVKIFDNALRKIKVPEYSNNDLLQISLLSALRQNSNSLKQCKVYYECLRKIQDIPGREIVKFYEKLQNVTGRRYGKLNKNNQPLTAIKSLLKEYENTFKNSNIILTYNSLYVFNELTPPQLQKLISQRRSLSPKSKLDSQINIFLQARLEMKQNYKLSPETVTRMWSTLKDLPEKWKVILGFKIMTIKGGAQIAQFLVTPTLKIVSLGDNQIDNGYILSLVARIAFLKDDKLIKKLAPQLINYPMQEINRLNSISLAYFLTLAFRAGNKQVVKKLLDNPQIAQCSDIYIALANLGAKELIKNTLDKNWRHLALPPIVKISTKGLICAEKICKEIKNPEKNYVAKTLFAGAPVYYKDRNGKIDYNRYCPQSITLNKLAKEFCDIKFGNEQRKIFCLSILFRHMQLNRLQTEILADKASKEIFDISFNEIFKSKYPLFTKLTGEFYMICLRNGDGREIIAKLNELIKLYNGADKEKKRKAQEILESCAVNFPHLVHIEHMKDTACAGRLIFTCGAVRWHECPLNVVWLNYLSGQQKEFITAMKNISDKRNQICLINWRQQMYILKTFCEKNNFDAQTEIMGFLDSPLIKSTCKNKPKELDAIKKYMLSIFEKQKVCK